MTSKFDKRPFIKMHGLGNDFVIFDAREKPVALAAGNVRRLADRRRGIGCDQLIIIEPGRDTADCMMHIFNADGTMIGACGNATRCVARLLMEERACDQVSIQTMAGVLFARKNTDQISVNMGPAKLDWQDIPVSHKMDTLHLDLKCGPLEDPVGVNMGNPHAVFFHRDVEDIDLNTLGAVIENHSLFPEKVNVSVAAVQENGTLRLRVFERGVGITQACGTAACASVVAAHRRGLMGRAADVKLDGGILHITWCEDGSVEMTGPAETSYAGEVLL